MNQQRPALPGNAEVQSITAAHTPRSVDQSARIRRYLISMSIRTVCVVGAVIVQGPLRWVFIVGAVLLPYVAVVMANAVGSGQAAGRGGPPPVHRVALPREADVRDSPRAPAGEAPARRSAGWTNAGSPDRKS